MIGIEITKPKRLLAEQETLRPNYGKFIAEPLARGFGTTIGNSLRRVLLSSIEGAAIVAVSIDGISHEYDTIEGVREDVVQIILNLKAIRFLVYIEDPITLHLHAEGSVEITAADITPSGQVEVINPDQHIAYLDRCDSLDIRLRVLRGRGYALAGEPLEDNLAEGVIPIDAKFSPVNKVDFKVEETRVGHITNFDRLLLEVWTDGSLTAKDAVTEAAKILLDQLNLFTNFDEHYVEPVEVIDAAGPDLHAATQRVGAVLYSFNQTGADHQMVVEVWIMGSIAKGHGPQVREVAHHGDSHGTGRIDPVDDPGIRTKAADILQDFVLAGHFTEGAHDAAGPDCVGGTHHHAVLGADPGVHVS